MTTDHEHVTIDEARLVGGIAVQEDFTAEGMVLVSADMTPSTLRCAECGEVLLEGPVTVPHALLRHLKPCETPEETP